MKVTTHLQLVPRSRKCGSIHPLPHTPSWHCQGQLYLLYHKIQDKDCKFSVAEIWNETAFVFNRMQKNNKLNKSCLRESIDCRFGNVHKPSTQGNSRLHGGTASHFYCNCGLTEFPKDSTSTYIQHAILLNNHSVHTTELLIQAHFQEHIPSVTYEHTVFRCLCSTHVCPTSKHPQYSVQVQTIT
jgi:hypothetical protein